MPIRNDFGYASIFCFTWYYCKGDSRIFDYRYPKRIAYANELRKLIKGDIVDAKEE